MEGCRRSGGGVERRVGAVGAGLGVSLDPPSLADDISRVLWRRRGGGGGIDRGRPLPIGAAAVDAAGVGASAVSEISPGAGVAAAGGILRGRGGGPGRGPLCPVPVSVGRRATAFGVWGWRGGGVGIAGIGGGGRDGARRFGGTMRGASRGTAGAFGIKSVTSLQSPPASVGSDGIGSRPPASGVVWNRLSASSTGSSPVSVCIGPRGFPTGIGTGGGVGNLIAAPEIGGIDPRETRVPAVIASVSSGMLNAGDHSFIPSRQTDVEGASLPLASAAQSSSVETTCSTPWSSVKRHSTVLKPSSPYRSRRASTTGLRC